MMTLVYTFWLKSLLDVSVLPLHIIVRGSVDYVWMGGAHCCQPVLDSQEITEVPGNGAEPVDSNCTLPEVPLSSPKAAMSGPQPHNANAAALALSAACVSRVHQILTERIHESLDELLCLVMPSQFHWLCDAQ